MSTNEMVFIQDSKFTVDLVGLFNLYLDILSLCLGVGTSSAGHYCLFKQMTNESYLK